MLSLRGEFLVVDLDQLPLERKEVEKSILPRWKDRENISCILTNKQ